jgi:hypothetical protein
MHLQCVWKGTSSNHSLVLLFVVCCCCGHVGAVGHSPRLQPACSHDQGIDTHPCAGPRGRDLLCVRLFFCLVFSCPLLPANHSLVLLAPLTASPLCPCLMQRLLALSLLLLHVALLLLLLLLLFGIAASCLRSSCCRLCSRDSSALAMFMILLSLRGAECAALL